MAKAIDPVCGMEVDTSTGFRAEYSGTTYYFCSEGCRRKFEADPAKYVGAGGSPHRHQHA